MSLNKFRGCLAGALIGDCLGAPFEGLTFKHDKVTNHFRKIAELPRNETEIYTDDTAMTWALAKSLIRYPEFNAKDVAESFCKAYYEQPHRGYGGNVVEVFKKWSSGVANDKEAFLPATAQFNGLGSYGNGGAMRVSPVSLLYQNDYQKMINVAKLNTLLTHSNQKGYDGAILQCICTWLALQEDSQEPNLDVANFVDKMIKHWKQYVEEQVGEAALTTCPYVAQLNFIQSNAMKDVDHKTIVSELGNDISASRSVSTAIYSFLRASQPLPNIPINNPFARTMAYAISMCGDTDTIASMAGAIAGAYYGLTGIPDHFLKCCEDYLKAIELADELHSLFKNHQPTRSKD